MDTSINVYGRELPLTVTLKPAYNLRGLTSVSPLVMCLTWSEHSAFCVREATVLFREDERIFRECVCLMYLNVISMSLL